jgi:hypothetical protein
LIGKRADGRFQHGWPEQRAPERTRRRGAGTLETTTPSCMQTERRRRSRAIGVRRRPDGGQRARCRGGRRAAARATSFRANDDVGLDSVDWRMVAPGRRGPRAPVARKVAAARSRGRRRLRLSFDGADDRWQGSMWTMMTSRLGTDLRRRRRRRGSARVDDRLRRDSPRVDELRREALRHRGCSGS